MDEEATLGKQETWAAVLAVSDSLCDLEREILPAQGRSLPSVPGPLLGLDYCLCSSCFGHKRAAKGFRALKTVGQLGFKTRWCVHLPSLSRGSVGAKWVEGSHFLSKELHLTGSSPRAP